MNTSQEDVKTDKSYEPYFLDDLRKRSHTRRAPVETKSANKYVRTTTENQKENSRSVSVLFPRGMWFLNVQRTRLTQLSYSVSFSRRLLKKCRGEWFFFFLLVNEDKVLCVRSFLPWRDYHHISNTRINLFDS